MPWTDKSKFLYVQKKDIKVKTQRKATKQAANARSIQNRVNRGNWSRQVKVDTHKEIPFPVMVK